jgi:hypothetical protein
MKKRKLNSNNPIYKDNLENSEKQVLRKVHMCDAIIRTANGKDTGNTAAVHGIWYK